MNRSHVISAIFFLLLGIFISYFFIPQSGSESLKALRLVQSQYTLINPLLICNANQIGVKEDPILENKIKSFIENRKHAGLVEDMSVYIINYSAGTVSGVNENEQYDPASLLKVPVMIAYYQLSEQNPNLLRESLSYNGQDQNSSQFFKSSHNIRPNVNYTIEELITSMIENSDNTALTLLTNYVGQRSLENIYGDLGLPLPPDNPTVKFISAKSYASFFRVLYNATYLSRADSQKALELLAAPDFPQGILGGVPQGTVVANKFGERTVYNESGAVSDRELHDCGIVYKPNKPYLLCIMSRGNDFNNLASNIKDLSTLVYQNI